MAKKEQATDIQILEIHQGVLTVRVVSDSPLIINRLAEKARQELLLPGRRKNAAERQTTLKHNPIEEYRASAHYLDDGPTVLALPAAAFKRALASAALDMPGTKKAQIGRLTYVVGEYVPIYGVPKIYLAAVRSSDMNRTPDIRSRCIVPQWAAEFDVSFVQPALTPGAILNLISASGIYIGVGDGRPEKGALSFGRFHTVTEKDKTFDAIVKAGGRKLQLAALESPEPYDAETRRSLEWFEDELRRREYRQPKATAAESEVSAND